VLPLSTSRRRPFACLLLLLLPLLLALVPAAAPAQGVRDESPARLLYVVREGDTFIASNVLFSRTDEFELAAQERVAEERRDNAILIVATNRRLIGYSVYTAAWVTLPLKAGERLEQLEAEDYSGFALTSRRIMNFNGRTGEWSESRR
jgi:hypothetical protein